LVINIQSCFFASTCNLSLIQTLNNYMLLSLHTATATAIATTADSFLLKHHVMSLICLNVTFRKNTLTSIWRI